MDEKSSGGGPEHRFRRLYVDLYPDVLRFVQRRVFVGRGDGAGAGAAEDVTAEVFLAVWRRVDDVPEGRDASRAWVFGVARNLLLNSRRGARRQQALDVRLADAEHVRTMGSGAAALGADDVALQIDLERAWGRLSAAHQEVLALAVLDGLESAEAGAVIGVTANAYRLRLSRARKALRSALGSEHSLPGSAGSHRSDTHTAPALTSWKGSDDVRT